jgi:hypothetical protein
MFTANQFVLEASPLRPMSRIFIFQTNTCSYSPYITSSLTGGLVCHLELLLRLASAVILMSQHHGTHDQILLSQIRDSFNLENQVPVRISPRQRVPFSLPRRATVEVFDPAADRLEKADFSSTSTAVSVFVTEDNCSVMTLPCTAQLWDISVIPEFLQFRCRVTKCLKFFSRRQNH